MRLISDIIADMRLELTDEQQTRWTDTQALLAIGRGIRRIAHILFRNDIELGRTVTNFDTSPGEAQYSLPDDFMAPYGLYRAGKRAKLQKESDDSWEQLQSPEESTSWIIRGDYLYIAETPADAYTMNLVYWAVPDTSALTIIDDSPYSGKLDDSIALYASLILKNVDEMEATVDAQILQEIEKGILETYSSISPETVGRRGWNI